MPPRVESSRSSKAAPASPALLADLDRPFGQDWEDQLGRYGLETAFGAQIVSDVVKKVWHGAEGEPFLWFLSQAGESTKSPDPYCCGIVCAANTARFHLLRPALPDDDIAEGAEFFVWLRGPYRSMGEGTGAVSQILQVIEPECAFAVDPGPLRRLTVYYPPRGPGLGGEIERWMNFFFDHWFRLIWQADTGVRGMFAVLKRELNG